MKKVVLVSTDTLWDAETERPYPGIAAALRQAKQTGSLPVLLSSHAKPAWFDQHFEFMQFVQVGFNPPRQSGKVVHRLVEANKNKFAHSDFIVLGASDTDFLMAVNSKTFLIRADWARNLGEKIISYGVPISRPKLILKILPWLDDEAPWYFHYEDDTFDVFALSNAGTMNEPQHREKLAEHLRSCLKDGVTNYAPAFKLHLISSLCKTELFRGADIWSYFPSSSSSNTRSEVMADFCDLARKTFKGRSAKPLLLRHKPAVKRHIASGNRIDPTSQLETVCLNPKYGGKIGGRTVVVLDDYLTKGVSFGVADALLKAAGAKSVIAVAMGKFGRSSNVFSIDIESDPFAPLTKYNVRDVKEMSGEYCGQAKLAFLKKFRDL